MSLRKEDKVHIALVGNPGAGKSALLNSLAGGGLEGAKHVFTSGISIGSGLTKCLQEAEFPEHVLVDSPGLADALMRKEAAAELNKLLKSVRRLKLVFVVTLRSGRVQSDDLTTMKLVLDALGIEDLNNKYGIIINAVSPEVIEMLKIDENKTIITECLNKDPKRKTNFIRIIEMDPALLDKRNVVVPPNEALLELLSFLPDVTLDQTKVQTIDVNRMDDQIAHFEELITRIVNANKEEIAVMRQQQEETNQRLMDALKAQNQAEVARIRAEEKAKLDLAEAARKREVDRIKFENQIATEETKRANEAKLHELELKAQAERMEAEKKVAEAEAKRAAAEEYARRAPQVQYVPSGGGAGDGVSSCEQPCCVTVSRVDC